MQNTWQWTYIAGAAGLFALLYFVNKTRTEKSKQQLRSEIPVAAIKKNMTLSELKQYNGEGSSPVFVALKGVIYDVSSSEFYRKPSGYAVFAGHDASINLAKMMHDEELLNKYWDKEAILTADERGALEDWVQRFAQKYPIVGEVIRQ